MVPTTGQARLHLRSRPLLITAAAAMVRWLEEGPGSNSSLAQMSRRLTVVLEGVRR